MSADVGFLPLLYVVGVMPLRYWPGTQRIYVSVTFAWSVPAFGVCPANSATSSPLASSYRSLEAV